MDALMISKIANEIVNETILLNWKFYVLLVFITFITTCISSFVFPYLKTRGKAFATEADFKSLLNQLEKTTETTETIKRAITHNDWALKEFKLLKRNKLEELLITLYDIERWISEQTNNILFRETNNKSASPIKNLSLIGLLYFTELKTEIKYFEKCYSAYNLLLLSEGKKLKTLEHEENKIKLQLEFAIKYKQEDVDNLFLKLKEVGDKTNEVIDKAANEFLKIFKIQLHAVSTIEKKAGLLMQEYIKVELDEAAKIIE